MMLTEMVLTTMIHPLFQQRTAKAKIKAELQAANKIGAIDGDATVSDGADAGGKTTYTITKGYATVADTLVLQLTCWCRCRYDK